jgi:putative sigma-54 modulation protein
MRIDIQGMGFPLTAPLLEHTERRLRFALTRISDRIKRVVVRLRDTNGPRGGEDKCCTILVVLEGAPSVVIEDAGADLYAVIDRAAERAGRNVAKRADRRRENARPQPPVPPSSEAHDEFNN